MEEPKQTESTAENTSKSKNEYMVPLSIIVAGVLIAGAVMFSGGSSTPQAQKPSLESGKALKKGSISAEVGLDKKAFAECLASGKFAERVASDIASGTKAGVEGTPYSVIWSKKTGKAYPVNGAYPYEEVKKSIDDILAGRAKGEARIALDPMTSADHVLGNRDAEIVIFEYSDTECPFCKRFHATMQQVMTEYGASGKVAWVYRHYPIPQLHSRAPHEAEATECAASLGGEETFWKYLDTLMDVTPANNGLDPKLL